MSAYFKSLSPAVQARYLAKIAIINNIDPYECDESSFVRDVVLFPNIEYGDIRNYFVDTVSAYTHIEFKAYKALDSYKFYKCGWVRDILVMKVEENILILGKVMHSQKTNEQCLKPWAIVNHDDGTVLSGHCNCVAGLGEACSHLGALLFAVAGAVQFIEETSVTDVKAYWMIPRIKIAQKVPWSDVLAKHNKIKSSAKIYPEQTTEEFNNLLEKIKVAGYTSALMTVTAPYCFEADEEEGEIPNILKELYKKEYESLPLSELLKKKVVLNVTPDDCQKVEEATRGQSDNKLWFEHRLGRITASKFKNACCTKIDKPAVSTIKSICYPHKNKFFSKYTEYGCKHEKDALENYAEIATKTHGNFAISKVGLILSPEYPHFGASPDAVISCNCCGHGCVEVKCPYCLKESSLEEHLPKYIKNGKLIKSHQYYYQIQMQMVICNKKFCDFVVWTKHDIYIEKIMFDEQFWQSESQKATEFWQQVIIPELFGKYFTRQIKIVSPPEEATSAGPTEQWCTCRKPDEGTPMVKCRNELCSIQWYHLKCTNLKKIPKSWVCLQCSNIGFAVKDLKHNK